MNIAGRKVSHKHFGEGTVTAHDGGTLQVLFEGGAGAKKFIYPTAFEGFLRFCDPAEQAEVDALLSDRKAQAAAERARREAEDRKRITLQRRALLEQRKAAAKKAKKV